MKWKEQSIIAPAFKPGTDGNRDFGL